MAPNRESAGHVIYRVANKRRFLFMLSCLCVLLVLMASVLSAKAGTDIGTLRISSWSWKAIRCGNLRKRTARREIFAVISMKSVYSTDFKTTPYMRTRFAAASEVKGGKVDPDAK
jgi:hypothetical protein